MRRSDFNFSELECHAIDDRPVHSILCELNSSSYDTLTRLKLNLHHGCITGVRDPYTGLCLDTVPKLTHLRELVLDLTFKGPHHTTGIPDWESTLSHPSRPAAWATLDTALPACLDLQRVELRVTIKPWSSRTRETRKNNRMAAEAVREYVARNIGTVVFPRLYARRDRGEIEIEIVVSV